MEHNYFFLQENPIYQKRIDKERMIYTLERGLLGVGYDECKRIYLYF